MKKIKTDPTKTVLTIAVGFMVIYLITSWSWAIWASLTVGLIGVFSDYLSKKIDFLWMKLTWVLSFIVPNIMLSIVFYLFLFPFSLLAKFFSGQDPLLLKKPTDSAFTKVEKQFDKKSFEHPW